MDVEIDSVDRDEVAEMFRELPYFYERIRSGLILVNGRCRPL
jgi:hypothetical protein